MRKLTVTLFAAGAALALAAPASAQYYGGQYVPQQPYGYGGGYGYNAYGQVQRLQMRVDALQHFIQRLDRADRVTSRKARDLKREAFGIEQRLRMASAYGLNPIEAREIENRLGRLEQKVSYATIQRFGRDYGRQPGYGAPGYGYGYGNAYGGGYGYGQNFDRNDADRSWGGHDRDDDDDD
jgi:hypothetical protein